jgi:phosphonopyruvate decarboxylase
MINAEQFVRSAVSRGYDFWSGVPCSILTPLINYVIDAPNLQYIAAASEGEAVAIAIGGHLAGRKPVVICQNSGLGNMVNPLTSLGHPFQIPILLIVTHRGEPGIGDQPQHSFMGAITKDLLNVLNIPFKQFPQQTEDIDNALQEADEYMGKTNMPYALIMAKGSVSPYQRENKSGIQICLKVKPEGEFMLPPDQRLKRLQVISIIRDLVSDTGILIGTTGKTGRELFALGHTPNQFYVVGGLGCASGIGLGLSLNLKDRKVVVLDGDAATLMKMGSLATIGSYHPDNLIHFILDNEAHESTGGQGTCSGSMDFAEIASACSYRAVFRCDTVEAIEKAVKKSIDLEGPIMIHVKIGLGSDPDLPRPNLTPVEIKEQFIDFIACS